MPRLSVVACAVFVLCLLVGFAGLASIEPLVPTAATVAAPRPLPMETAGHDRADREGTGDGSSKVLPQRRAAGMAAAPDAAPNVPVYVAVRQRLGESKPHYTGPLRIEGEPAGPRDLDVRSSAPIAVTWRSRSGGSVEPLLFHAPGFRVASTAPASEPAPRDSVEVVLEPAASLVFEVFGAAAADPCFDVAVEFGERMAACSLRGATAGGVATARGALEVPGGGDRAWSVDWRDGERLVRATGVAVALGVDERRVVTVDLREVPLQRHRLVGPSAALLAHCTVAWQRSGRRGGLDQVPVAVDGSFYRSPSEQDAVFVRLAEGTASTRLLLANDEVQCEVEDRLVGLQLVDLDSKPVATRWLGELGQFRGDAAEVHLVRLTDLPDTVTLWVDAHRIRTFAVPRRDGDLIVLHEADAVPQTSVTVVVEGESPPSEFRRTLALLLRQVDGTVSRRQQVVDRATFVLPAGGEFELAWCVETSSGPPVLRVALANGEARVVNVAWPQVCAWTGEVEGHLQTPLPQRCHRVSFGAGASFLAGWTMRLDAQGRFRGCHFAATPPPGPVFLVWGTMKLPAYCEQPDPSVPHLVVRPASTLRWHQFEVQAPPPWLLVVSEATPDGPRTVHVVTPEQQWPMPIGEAVARSWVLERFEGEQSTVLAFGEVGPAERTRIAPASIREVVVQGRGQGDSTCCWIGPHGQSSSSFEVRAGARLRAQVPADTRGLRLRDDAAVSGWRELPMGADGIVRLDG